MKLSLLLQSSVTPDALCRREFLLQITSRAEEFFEISFQTLDSTAELKERSFYSREAEKSGKLFNVTYGRRNNCYVKSLRNGRYENIQKYQNIKPSLNLVVAIFWFCFKA